MLYIGTSGWSYHDWQGLFYPRGISGAKRLPFYAEHYNSVELNATFYRFPSDGNLSAWNRACPKDFVLSVKGSRRISHARGLPDASTVAYFFKRITQLSAIRTVLWQLPPHRARDLDYLGGLLKRLKSSAPRGLRQAIEFRHESWWHDDTYEALTKARVAFVQISHPTLPAIAPDTASFRYVRFHGLDAKRKYHYSYSAAQLSLWARRLRRDAPRDTFIYFNNDYEGHALHDAVHMRDMLQDHDL